MNSTPHIQFNAKRRALDAQWSRNICGLIASGAKRNDQRTVPPMMYRAHGKPAF